MNRCVCGSYAINPGHHGREAGIDLDLCDVCYWRKRAQALEKLTAVADAAKEAAGSDIFSDKWLFASNKLIMALKIAGYEV